MFILNFWQMLLFYGISLLLVHVSTNGFKTDAPVFSILPLVSLIIMTMGTRMKRIKKYCTAGSFFFIAIGVYYWALLPKHIIARALLFCISSSLYLYTFIFHVKKLWRQLAVVMGVFCVGFVYYSVGDLFRSLPFLVVGVAADMIMLCISITAAGSLWKYGVKGNPLHEAKSAALMRFVALLIELVCASAVLFNHFLNHHNFHHYMLFYYIAKFVLFIANERTF